ncbi:MAG: sigma-54-dependent Fis family transcriptional regulator, partial [Legionella longbeachae]|nr:sigma-54-dependent Fis family transcriptional regulator [Legionella longbeachae]
MGSNDKVYIIDNNESRADKLSMILNFVGETTEVTNYGKWQLITDVNPDILIVGGAESVEETLNELDSLMINFVKVPVIVIGQKLNNTQCILRNVVACQPFPFSYAQIMESLHQCQIAKKAVKSIIVNNHKNPLLRSLVGKSHSIQTVRKLIEQVS